MADSLVNEKKGQPLLFAKKTNNTLTKENAEILETLDNLEDKLDALHKKLDYLTDTELIDGCIYEIKALHMQYKYYLQICKERGLIAAGFNKIS